MARVLPLAVVFLSLSVLCNGVLRPPTVNVYTTHPVEDGKNNTVICHVKGYHPPNIEVDLYWNGEKIDQVQAKDQTFSVDWNFEWMKFCEIIGDLKDAYSCRVKHGDADAKEYMWDPMF
ncbi:beta-2-microglobulin-like isoform X1 [Ambystoma mexicanum]|uniref:Beta-2-microglobulin n=1 Tax=Ailuropoda melanoleuca TaxID=9646 RepID=A0A7N5J8A8_AILME